MSHFSCFFFRKRRNKRNQTEREKRRKASLAVRKSDSTGFAGLRGLVILYPFATKNNVVQTLFFVRLVWGIQHPFQRGLGEFAGLNRWWTVSDCLRHRRLFSKTMLFRHRFCPFGLAICLSQYPFIKVFGVQGCFSKSTPHTIPRKIYLIISSSPFV